MDFFKQAESLLKNPVVKNLADQYVLNNQKSPPKVSVPVAAAQPLPAMGMSKDKMIMIGAGILALIGIVFFAIKRK